MRKLMIFVSGLTFGIAGGFTVAAGSEIKVEGHAHIYINGVKLARLYSDWYRLDIRPKGDVEIEVLLNTNDHRPLALNGNLIAAKTTVIVG